MKTQLQKNHKLHEEACFYILCAGDFDQVISTFNLLKICVKPELRYRLLVFIIISYARPFTKNRGKLGVHKLTKKIVPSACRKLHDEIMYYRDKIIAHKDIDYLNPRLSNIGMVFKGVYYDDYKKLILQKPVLKMVEVITGNLALKIRKTLAALEMWGYR